MSKDYDAESVPTAPQQTVPDTEPVTKVGGPPTSLPHFVTFDSEGQWKPDQVIANLERVVALPAKLKAAIRKSPQAVASFCVSLRGIVEARRKSKPDVAAECKRIEGALTSRVTELVFASPSSPLTYGQLASVASWWDTYSTAPIEEDLKAADKEAEAEQKPAATQESTESAGAAEADPAIEAGKKVRAGVVAQLEYWRKHPYDTEGSGGKFDEFFPPGSLTGQRMDPNFTTCNSAGGLIGGHGGESVGVKGVNLTTALLYPQEAAEKRGAWVAAGGGATPKPGDFMSYQGHAGFLHEVTRGTAPQWYKYPKTGKKPEADVEVELWTTVDGGQGTQAVFDADGKKIGRSGTEAITRAANVYNRDDATLSTPTRFYNKPRQVIGWVDMEKLGAALYREQNPKD